MEPSVEGTHDGFLLLRDTQQHPLQKRRAMDPFVEEGAHDGMNPAQ